MSISSIGTAYISPAYGKNDPAAGNTQSGGDGKIGKSPTSGYAIPGAFSLGKGAIDSAQVNDPKAAFDTLARKFEAPTLRDAVLKTTGRTDPNFHDKHYYATVSSMFEQMAPTFVAAAKHLVSQIYEQHVGEDGKLTQEGRAALDEVLSTVERTQSHVRNMQEQVGNDPTSDDTDPKLRLHQKAIKEQEKSFENRWTAMSSPANGRQADSVSARLDKVLDSLRQLLEDLKSFQPPAVGGLIDVTI